MFFSTDMKDLISLFHKHDVVYALVGGFAVNYYGYSRMTQDIDFLIYPSERNAKNIMSALEEFGFGNTGIPQELFENEGAAIHLGVEPNRIDLLTHLVGISNDRIFKNRTEVLLDKIPVYIIHRSDLIQIKKSSERLRDQADAEELEKLTNTC